MTPRNQQHESDAVPVRAGAPFVIATDQIEQRWPVIGQVIERAQAWTRLIVADHIRAQLESGDMRAWGSWRDIH